MTPLYHREEALSLSLSSWSPRTITNQKRRPGGRAALLVVLQSIFLLTFVFGGSGKNGSSFSFLPATLAFRASRTTATKRRRGAQNPMIVVPPLAAVTTGSSSWQTSFENWLYDASNAANGLAVSSLNNNYNNGMEMMGNNDPHHWAALPVLYLAGLLTSFSPCVWGLLPVTISYISQATKERTDRNALYPTVCFALGLTTVFCGLGVAATTVGGAVVGSGGDHTNNNAMLAIASNAICLVMGLRILELIDIPLPSLNFVRDAVLSSSSSTGGGGAGNSSGSSPSQPPGPIFIDATGQILTTTSKTTAVSTETTTTTAVDEWGSLFRTFLLGGSSALAASPCATPVLTSILAFVAASSSNNGGGAASAATAAGSTTTAFLLLLFYSLGYATPLLLVAGTGGQALAKLKAKNDDGTNTSLYGRIGPWVTPLTGAILLWYGTTGLLTSVLGDPSLLGLPVFE